VTDLDRYIEEINRLNEAHAKRLEEQNRRLLGEMVDKLMVLAEEEAERNRKNHELNQEQYETRLRDQFALGALQGILSCYKDYAGAGNNEDRCKLAWTIAEKMMKTRPEQK
jgi:hypothetical protein